MVVLWLIALGFQLIFYHPMTQATFSASHRNDSSESIEDNKTFTTKEAFKGVYYILHANKVTYRSLHLLQPLLHYHRFGPRRLHGYIHAHIRGSVQSDGRRGESRLLLLFNLQSCTCASIGLLCLLQTFSTPVCNLYLGWDDREISLMFCAAGVIVSQPPTLSLPLAHHSSP
mgnify:CR=1 FL=1